MHHYYFIMMMLLQYFHVCVEILNQPQGSKMTSIVFNGYKNVMRFKTCRELPYSVMELHFNLFC